jgi:DNA repair protein RecO (recombination protein O)
MTHKTKGIVLRTIKYGETSLVVTIYTELFGVQTYMVNAIRTTKRSGNKAAMFQPAAILEMEVYHNDQRSMQRIKEYNWAFLYRHILSEVVKNSIALYLVELLFKTLKQPEANSNLFYFCEDALMQLDAAEKNISANFALFFSLHLADFFGFKINGSNIGNTGAENLYLDLREGEFVARQPTHPDFIHGDHAAVTAELLKIRLPAELDQLKLNQQTRRELLMKFHDYYALHIHDFGQMKTLQVLHEVLS